jgi:hypothetical protein
MLHPRGVSCAAFESHAASVRGGSSMIYRASFQYVTAHTWWLYNEKDSSIAEKHIYASS